MSARSDFADWISPMVVKELRQNMRSRLFVFSFLVIQAAMIFVAIIGLSASARQEDTSVMTGFFWTIIGVLLLLVMPMSGLNAVGNERKANTLELMFLTRLSARRIVAGKWFAIVAQTILLVCAVLPYSVLRYFQGGINIGTELTIIATLLLSSILLSGMAVGLSPQSSRLMRTLLVVGGFIALQSVPRLFFGVSWFGGSVISGPGLGWKIYGALIWLGILVLLLMLEFGASRISPLAENHSSSRRLLGLIMIGAVEIFGRDFSASPLFTCSAIIMGAICVGALCEPPRFLPAIYRPFVRFGTVGKIAGRLLYPGWPSGVFYTVFAATALTAIARFQGGGSIDPKWIIWAGIAAAGTLLFPAAILHGFASNSRRPFFVYIGIQVVLALLVALCASLAAFNVADFRSILALIPTCGLMLVGTNVLYNGNYGETLIGIVLVTGASLIWLLLKMRGPLRQIRELEKVAAQLPSARIVDASDYSTAK
jgi:hypothetical protein